MQAILNSLALPEQHTAPVLPPPVGRRNSIRHPYMPILWLVVATIGLLFLALRFVDKTFALNIPADCKNYITGMGQIDTQCGVIRVPEDRAHPEGRSINIVYRLIPPLNPQAKGL